MDYSALRFLRSRRWRARALGLALVLPCLCARADPLPPLAPATSEGNYVVTSRGCNDNLDPMSCLAQWVEERVEPDGEYRLTDGQFSGKAPGAYSYRSADTYCDSSFFDCVMRYSESVTVVVGFDIPELDPVEVQREYSFEARTRSAGGSDEILIERVAGGAPGNGVVDAVILHGLSSGAFTAIVPSAAERASTAWRSSSIGIALEDINVDGFVDLVVGNVAASIGGALDQIVFSSGQPLVESPKGVRAIDASLERFTANVIDYVANGEYFTETAPLVPYAGTYSTYYCPYDSGSDIDSYNDYYYFDCGWFTGYYTGVAPDYSGYSAEAIRIWGDEESIEQGAVTRSEGVDDIKQTAEDILHVKIGGWDVDDMLEGANGIDRSDYQKGLEVFLAILGIGNARADELDTDQAPKQVPRRPDIIYIVGRYVFGHGLNKLHTALFYKEGALGAPTWLSAFDSDLSPLGDGTLVARTNDTRDTPLLMRFTLGSVTPPAFKSSSLYFNSDVLPAHDHYRRLPLSEKAPYDAVPELPWCPWCKGRNSNGYVSGLIAATGGSPYIEPSSIYYDLTKLTGWEYPVEAEYFGR